MIQKNGSFLKNMCLFGALFFAPALSKIVGCDPNLIMSTSFEALEGKGKTGRIPALWDGKTSERIADVILQFIENGE